MSEPFIDTDVLIHFLTGDDLEKQAAVAALLEQVEQGKLTLAAPDTVIADAVFVLSSKRLYNFPREQVAALLTTLVRLPGLHIQNRKAVLRALELYAINNLDFGDTLIAASMEQEGTTVLYSYDKSFDRLPGITRQEPEKPAAET